MTADDFRKIALSLPEASENAHMKHPDFRVGGKVFATLGYPDEASGMVKLSPEQQASFMQALPEMFTPVKGAWGRGGATIVLLANADEITLRHALVSAWRNVAPKRLCARFDLQG
jgi:hypothetical protein